MASWNIPALINKISEDVPAIKALLTALFKWTDAGTEDVPEGAKRLQSVTGGRQIQEYSGSSWGSVGKLMHDVDMLDGKHASTAQTPDTIPVRDANGSIPGNITGNAATATTAASVSSEYVVPIANGGTGATSAANARTNLGTNNAENITQGVLATARGGTGRNDGKVTDVFLTDYQTGAVGLGQLGQAVLKNAINADSLTKQGRFLCDGCTVALNYPASGTYIVDVTNSGGMVVQKAFTIDGLQTHVRSSVNSGASWTGWTPKDMFAAGGDIYISKGGSDSNTGLSPDSPVLTYSRAINIAKGISGHDWIVFRFGPGEWGEIYVRPQLYKCYGVAVTNYTHSGKNTVAEFDALTDSGNTGNQPPHFTSFNGDGSGRLFIGNIHADVVDCSGVIVTGNTFAFSWSQWKDCWIALNPHKIVKMDGVTQSAINLEHSFLYMGAAVYGFVNSPTNYAYIYCSAGAELFFDGNISWSGAFPGRKFVFYTTAHVCGKSPWQYPGDLTGEGTFFYNGVLYEHGDIYIRNNQLKRGTPPPVNQYIVPIRFTGAGGDVSNKNSFWGLYHQYYTDKTNMASLLVFKGTDDSDTWSHIGVGFDASGNVFTFAPAPPANSNDLNIATTSWVHTATGNTTLNAANVTGVVAVANGGTGANTLAGARSALFGEAMSFENCQHFAMISDYHTHCGWLSVENARTLLNCLLLTGGTMTGSIFIHKDGPGIIHRNPYIVRGATSDYGRWTYDEYVDSNNKRLCWIGMSQSADASLSVQFSCANQDGTAETGLGVGYYSNKTAFSWAPTPPAASNDANIATTAWVRGRLGNGEFGMVPEGPWQWLSTNTLYTAPSNGYVYARNSKYSSCGQKCKITVNAVEYWMQNTSYGSGSCNPDNVVIVPIKKGWALRGNNLDVLGFLPA